jgi:hypothetical protein
MVRRLGARGGRARAATGRCLLDGRIGMDRSRASGQAAGLVMGGVSGHQHLYRTSLIPVPSAHMMGGRRVSGALGGLEEGSHASSRDPRGDCRDAEHRTGG